MMYIVLFLMATLSSVSHACPDNCNLPTIRQCSETDQSSCCQPLVDFDLNMQIGINAGEFMMVRNNIVIVGT